MVLAQLSMLLSRRRHWLIEGSLSATFHKVNPSVEHRDAIRIQNPPDLDAVTPQDDVQFVPQRAGAGVLQTTHIFRPACHLTSFCRPNRHPADLFHEGLVDLRHHRVVARFGRSNSGWLGR